MTRKELILLVSNRSGIDLRMTTVIAEELFATVKETLGNGEEIFVRGFGGFILKKRAFKVGRNINNNSSIDIPEHYIPKFKPSKKFLNQIKNSVQI